MQFLPISSRTKDDAALRDLADYSLLRFDALLDDRQDRILEICFAKSLNIIETEIGQALLDKRSSAEGNWQFPCALELDLAGEPTILSVRQNDIELNLGDFWIEPIGQKYNLCSKLDKLENAEIVMSQGAKNWASLADEYKWMVLSSAGHFYEYRGDEDTSLPQAVMNEISRQRPLRMGFSK